MTISESHTGGADTGKDEGLSWAKYPALHSGYMRLHLSSRVQSWTHRAGGGESFLTTALISWCPEEWRLITFIFGCRTANVTNGHKIIQSFSKYNQSKLIYWAQFIQYFLLWQNSQKIICLLHVSTIWCHSMQAFFLHWNPKFNGVESPTEFFQLKPTNVVFCQRGHTALATLIHKPIPAWILLS